MLILGFCAQNPQGGAEKDVTEPDLLSAWAAEWAGLQQVLRTLLLFLLEQRAWPLEPVPQHLSRCRLALDFQPCRLQNESSFQFLEQLLLFRFVISYFYHLSQRPTSTESSLHWVPISQGQKMVWTRTLLSKIQLPHCPKHLQNCLWTLVKLSDQLKILDDLPKTATGTVLPATLEDFCETEQTAFWTFPVLGYHLDRKLETGWGRTNFEMKGTLYSWDHCSSLGQGSFMLAASFLLQITQTTAYQSCLGFTGKRKSHTQTVWSCSPQSCLQEECEPVVT